MHCVFFFKLNFSTLFLTVHSTAISPEECLNQVTFCSNDFQWLPMMCRKFKVPGIYRSLLIWPSVAVQPLHILSSLKLVSNVPTRHFCRLFCCPMTVPSPQPGCWSSPRLQAHPLCKAISKVGCPFNDNVSHIILTWQLTTYYFMPCLPLH